MKLELDPLDLQTRFKKRDGTGQAIPTSEVTFDKLTPEAQAAVKAVGRAMFYAFDRLTYNTIYPPNPNPDSKPVLKRDTVRINLPPVLPQPVVGELSVRINLPPVPPFTRR